MTMEAIKDNHTFLSMWEKMEQDIPTRKTDMLMMFALRQKSAANPVFMRLFFLRRIVAKCR